MLRNFHLQNHNAGESTSRNMDKMNHTDLLRVMNTSTFTNMD